MESSKKTKPQKRSSIRRLVPLFIAIGSLTLCVLLLNAIRKNERVANFFTYNVSKYIVGIMGRVSSLLPFSLYEFILLLCILCLVVLFILAMISLGKKRFFVVFKGLCIVAVAALAMLNWYVLSAGFLYYRSPLNLAMHEAHYTQEEFVDIAEYFMDDFCRVESKMTRDKNGNVVMPYTHKELSEVFKKEYARLDDNDYFFRFTPRYKTLVNSWFMSSTDYAGVSFLPFGEPSVNNLMPPSSKVFTIAHEIAHAKGVMRENEANLVAYYILLTAKDDYLRYCGYYYSLNEISSMVALSHNLDWELSYTLVNNRIPQAMFDEYNFDIAYWQNYVGPFDFLGEWFTKIGDTFNEWYLKINGAQDGLDSYDNPYDYIPTDDVDPDTELPIYIPVYSNIHKLLFAIYDNR